MYPLVLFENIEVIAIRTELTIKKRNIQGDQIFHDPTMCGLYHFGEKTL